MLSISAKRRSRHVSLLLGAYSRLEKLFGIVVVAL